MSYTFALDLVAATAQSLGWDDATAHTAFLANGTIDPSLPVPKSPRIPMLTARRLNGGERMALNCALELLRDSTQALVFSSHHSELERNHRILTALAENKEVSPTDFTLSVNNSAPGNLTILTKRPLTVSALSASHESFAAALTEAYLMLQDQYEEVLVVDCDGAVPEFYHPHLAAGEFTLPFACAWRLRRGSNLQVELKPATAAAQDLALPASLAAWRALQTTGQVQLNLPQHHLTLTLTPEASINWV